MVRCGWYSGAVRVVQWCGTGGAVVPCGWYSGAVRVVQWCGAGGAAVRRVGACWCSCAMWLVQWRDDRSNYYFGMIVWWCDDR